jgi:hypothetical protein
MVNLIGVTIGSLTNPLSIYYCSPYHENVITNGSSSSHYRETGGMRWGMLIARKSSSSLSDEEEIEESSNGLRAAPSTKKTS